MRCVRTLLSLLTVIAAVMLTVADARAGTVVWGGTAYDGSGRYGSLTIETGDERKDGKWRTATLDLSFEVDGQVFTLGTTLRSRKKTLLADGFDVSFDASAGTLTFTAQDFEGQAPNALSSITFTFAQSFKKTPSVKDILKHFARSPITTITATAADGSLQIVTFGDAPPPTLVPLPAGAWLFLTGLGILARRRLVELGGIEPPTS